MCGLAGFLDYQSARCSEEALALVTAMNDSLHHRGPDDGGAWVEAEAGIALGHRRLSIVDLSPAGHQPMVSADGNYVLVYNGEIYNTEEVRTELPGRSWRGRSDSEVLLEACATWGVEAAVRRLIGMFAFALWNRRDRVLTLVRDRLGIKPLYWGLFRGTFGPLFLFGSELKALRVHPDWHPEVDRDALAGFLRHNYVPGPRSIYQGVSQLPPGTILTLAHGGVPRLTPFWSLNEVVRHGLANPLELSDPEAIELLDGLLRDAVGRRMVADVPLGCFLSGGVDSSTVVALMQAQSDRPVRTFSIGFREDAFNEAHHARAVAAHLGTDHEELYVGSDQALEVIPRLPELFDEPFADSSQLPTYLLAAMTKRHVTVALSGDGGDELFAGYARYGIADHMTKIFARIPVVAKRLGAMAASAADRLPWPLLNHYLPLVRSLRLSDRLPLLAELLGQSDSAITIYRRLISHWPSPDEVVIGAHEASLDWSPLGASHVHEPIARMQYLDTLTYLPDDILTKVDRTSMAVALEARVPLLDHRVVELAWHLPMRFKRRDGQTKWLLRQVLYRYVPPALIDRPKTGFGVPLDTWLRGPLRPWAEDLLDEHSLRMGGLFEPAPIRRIWHEHVSGTCNRGYLLWDILVAESWRRHWL
ncbi:MAG: asparagine synthase (glutamine-hydrolyzing) [Rhodospirillaceae bacterium]